MADTYYLPRDPCGRFTRMADTYYLPRDPWGAGEPQEPVHVYVPEVHPSCSEHGALVKLGGRRFFTDAVEGHQDDELVGQELCGIMFDAGVLLQIALDGLDIEAGQRFSEYMRGLDL